MNSDRIDDMGKYFDERTAEKLGGKIDGLDGILDTPDARAVKKKLENSKLDIVSAITNGDDDAIRAAFTDIVSTREGARLVSKLRDMLK
ncbi:MAG: hypothetical protein LBJ99_04605 [Oscillospiraceae bacterium]|jgi:hypothetical protein|nr:hypothetical protein [Oscillospiraceae bacterium]